MPDIDADNGADHRQQDGFLDRWSRRKSLARRGAELQAQTPAPVLETSLDELPKTADANAEPEQFLTDADMPPLESLGPDSDYSGFLSRGVSEALRRNALARLFRSPAFNVVDGLDDYAEDYTKFAPLGDIVTADMRHQLEQRLKRLADVDADSRASVDTGIGSDAERIESDAENEADTGAQQVAVEPDAEAIHVEHRPAGEDQ